MDFTTLTTIYLSLRILPPLKVYVALSRHDDIYSLLFSSSSREFKRTLHLYNETTRPVCLR